MALDFIKKVFTFGRKKADEAPEAQPAAPQAHAESFPHDGGAMQFTPETARNGSVSTPEPAEELNAGETPPGSEEPEGSSTTDDVTAAMIAADPAIERAQETEAFATDSPEPDTDEELAPEPDREREPVADSPGEASAHEPTLDVEGGEPVISDTGPGTPDRQRPSGPVTVGRTVETADASDIPEEAAPEAPKTWWQRLKSGMSRTSGQLSGQISSIFTKRKLDDDTLEELEEVLIQADLGVETAMRVTGALAEGRYGRDVSGADVRKVMAEEIVKVLGPVARPLALDLKHRPHVILVVGVNGTGKTTTIGKLAAKLTRGGLSVTLAAGDTFRAAAIEQLKIWGERTGSTVVSSKLGADAAGLAYEAFETAKANGSDVLIIDTAGRLQNKAELMDELAKVVRVIGKIDPDAPHTVLQTLDATTGQNAMNQVEIFRNVAGVNGLVMTKLDGTARGGILVAIAARHKLPVYFIGVGEGIDDLEPFEARDFALAIAGEA